MITVLPPAFFGKKIFKKMPYELASVFPLVLFEKKY